MNHEHTHLEQVVHRTCIGCGEVTHYDGSELDPEQLDVLQSLVCEECGESEAVFMMTDYDPNTLFTLAPLPARS
jgi:hypothetical protein